MPVNVCKECDTAFISRRVADFCSQACRSKAYYRKNTEKCKNLTKSWEAKNPERVQKRKVAYRERQQQKKSKNV